MAFDIEKMKADGVSAHLIELASMNQETFLLLIARRLENDKFFQQFMGENAGSIEAMYPYAVAAGLMSEEDRKWLIDEGNPYKTESGEVFMKAHATLDELRVMLDLEGERKQVPPRWLVHKMQELEVIEKGGDGLEMLYLGCKSIEEALARRDLLCIPSRHAFETLGVAWDARKA